MKPIAWRHMVMWGASAGFILGAAFMLFLFLLTMDFFTAFNTGFLFFLATAHVSAVLGMILGFANGFVIENTLPLKTSDFNRDKQNQQALKTLPAVFIVTAIMSFFLMDWTITLLWGAMPGIFQEVLLSANAWVAFGAPVIAALGAAYAAYRYLFRLRLYSEQPRKLKHLASKIKNHERQTKPALEDYLASQPQRHRSQRHD